MIGTLVNTLAIVVGSVVGGLLRHGLKQRYADALFTALGLCVLVLGVSTAIGAMGRSHHPVLFIAALAIGGVAGTALRLDERFARLTSRLSGGDLAQGLTTGILLYCIGTLSILGPVMSALYGDETFLLTNATLDFVTACVLASTYGYGMVLAAPVLFLWQGSIYVLALYGGSRITDDQMTELSIVGGVLIAASGLGILRLKDCHVLNLLPSLLVPFLYFWLRSLLPL